MARFVVLLRGVNVGGGRRVPMADFRDLLAGLGHEGVRTLLNSGNAVFDSPRRSAARHADEIAKALRARLGLDVPTVVKSAAEFAAAVDDCPFDDVPAEAHGRLLLAFGPDAASLKALAPLADLAVAPERFVVGAHAAYLHCPAGILDSAVGAALLGKAGRGVTTRNRATAGKLADMVASP